jgi:hypothetical protein
MSDNLFEQYINAIERYPHWHWEQQDGAREMWIARAAHNGGKAAMVCQVERGYRASLCIESLLPDNGMVKQPTLFETALAYEGSEFVTALDAMLWVEQQAWTLLARMLGSYVQQEVTPRLSIRRSDGFSREMEWHGVALMIGRERANDLVIEHMLASRYHACIERHHNGFVLRDLNSTNGTFINNTGQRVRGRHTLRNEEQILIADTVITFLAPVAV